MTNIFPFFITLQKLNLSKDGENAFLQIGQLVFYEECTSVLDYFVDRLPDYILVNLIFVCCHASSGLCG